MIIKSLEKLPERFIYIDSKSSKYNEDFKYIAKILCNIKISQNISNKNDIHLTLDPEFYFSNIKNNSNIRLYVFSIDIDNSNFINLFKYLNRFIKLELSISILKTYNLIFELFFILEK